jgi:hypothetical protein
LLEPIEPRFDLRGDSGFTSFRIEDDIDEPADRPNDRNFDRPIPRGMRDPEKFLDDPGLDSVVDLRATRRVEPNRQVAAKCSRNRHEHRNAWFAFAREDLAEVTEANVGCGTEPAQRHAGIAPGPIKFRQNDSEDSFRPAPVRGTWATPSWLGDRHPCI